ncbi:MAG: hypothetical protein AAB734_03320, partial [Patescibacteria group bacterium]
MYAPLHKIKPLFLAVVLAACAASFLSVDTAFAQARPPGVGMPPGTGTTPSPAPGSLSRDGIFGCRAAQYANIGTLTAIGGVYVPVTDAAVTLNTGYLVYKECVLDGVVAMIKNDIA